MFLCTPISTLFPYTTLFRSVPFSLPSSMAYSHKPFKFCQFSRTNWGRGYSGKGFDGSTSFAQGRSEEHTSELQSRFDLVCRLLLEKKKNKEYIFVHIT